MTAPAAEQDFFAQFQEGFEAKREETMSLMAYLDLCKSDKGAYANAAERLLDAIGEPKIVDTSKDEKLSRIFGNQKIPVYNAFSDFFGMEETIEGVVSFLRGAAQGAEERKQILYLLGPVGSAKSSIGERLKSLMEERPIYVLKAGEEISPVFESPLGLFKEKQHGAQMQARYGIEPRRLKNSTLSPWAVEKLNEFKGDISKFQVVKMYPSEANKVGIMKVEPGDENNQDISTIVGKPDLRKLEVFAQTDYKSYGFGGGLNRANQGLMEFVEMFKAPIKMLHPLLTATQEGHYTGTENIGEIPFSGIILAHSNESEWESFRNNKRNEAFLDRVKIIKAPYTLRVTEEAKIYRKKIDESSLGSAPCAPETLETLARFSVLTRLFDHANSNSVTKMRVYDGENLKETAPSVKTIQEYRDAAGRNEGFSGTSTRFAFKVLSDTFNKFAAIGGEVAADPIRLMATLKDTVKAEQFPADTEKKYLGIIDGPLTDIYKKYIAEEINSAFLESYDDFGQNIFDQYIMKADAWLQDKEINDPETGLIYDRAQLNTALEKIEKPAGIANPKDFRNEVINFVLRAQANNGGKNPDWKAYEKIRRVIQKQLFDDTKSILPVISFGAKADSEAKKKHEGFVERMNARGYTPAQVKTVVEAHMRWS